MLVAQSGETLLRVSGMCPHQDVCLDEGFYDGAVLTCHQHLWQWDIAHRRRRRPGRGAARALRRATSKATISTSCSRSALQAAEIFAGVGEQRLAATAGELARREENEAGSTLYELGDAADDLYVLESGRVEFLIGREERATAAGFMLRKGEVFGWNALLENQPSRIASAHLPREVGGAAPERQGKFSRILEADPASGFHVMRKLSNLITRYLTPSGAK